MDAVTTWFAAHWIELFGVLTGGAAVWFLARDRGPIGWTFGVINAVFFTVLFIGAKLYADTILNLYYFVTSGVGLYLWKFGGRRGVAKAPLPIGRVSLNWSLALAAITVVGTFLMGWLLQTTTDTDVAYIDSFTTVLSLVGQFMLMRKWIANWYVWLLADAVDVGLYAYKGLYLVTALTVVYGFMCVMGIIKWRKVERVERLNGGVVPALA